MFNIKKMFGLTAEQRIQKEHKKLLELVAKVKEQEVNEETKKVIETQLGILSNNFETLAKTRTLTVDNKYERFQTEELLVYSVTESIVTLTDTETTDVVFITPEPPKPIKAKELLFLKDFDSTLGYSKFRRGVSEVLAGRIQTKVEQYIIGYIENSRIIDKEITSDFILTNLNGSKFELDSVLERFTYVNLLTHYLVHEPHNFKFKEIIILRDFGDMNLREYLLKLNVKNYDFMVVS